MSATRFGEVVSTAVLVLAAAVVVPAVETEVPAAEAAVPEVMAPAPALVAAAVLVLLDVVGVSAAASPWVVAVLVALGGAPDR